MSSLCNSSSIENVANFQILLNDRTSVDVQYLLPDGSDGPAAENVRQDANCGNNRHACAPHDSALFKVTNQDRDFIKIKN